MSLTEGRKENIVTEGRKKRKEKGRNERKKGNIVVEGRNEGKFWVSEGRN